MGQDALNNDQRNLEHAVDVRSASVTHSAPVVAPMHSNNSSGGGVPKGLAPSIATQLAMLSRDTPSYGTVCIYKVPDKYRNQNPEAYTPRLISIGFIHYGQRQLQGMQEYKFKYLHHFLHTFRLSLEEVAKYAQNQEKLVCGYYEEIYINHVSRESKKSERSHEPYEVILLDGIFVVDLFLKNYFPAMRENGDIIFDNPLVANDILHDLLLFENQLPLRFLTTLFNTFVSSNLKEYFDDNATKPPSFNELAHKYFKNVGNTGELILKGDFRNAKHFIEFLSALHTQGEDQVLEFGTTFGKKSNFFGTTYGKKSDFFKCPTATELKAVGVKLRRGAEDSLLKVEFTKENGILKIPQLTINDSTEPFFRNIIAFEQSGYHSKYITSYIVLLDNLIDTHRDVDLLIDNKIIRNEFGSSEEVAQLFNNLYKEVLNDPREFHYCHLCRELNDYSRDRWHKWKAKLGRWFAMLGREYFNSPWTIISLIAAIILLVLTVVQTVCSIIQI